MQIDIINLLHAAIYELYIIMRYGADIMGNINAGAAGWIDWNILLNENGGPVRVRVRVRHGNMLLN